MDRITIDEIIWNEIVLELIEMGFAPDEAAQYADAMVETELGGSFP